jgi:outer membrane protein
MKNLIAVTLFLFIGTSVASAQKMAHADISAILSVMPDNEKINQDLQIYATGLSKRVEDMKAQLDGAVKQFNQVLATGDTAKALEIQKQGMEMDKEIQQAAQQAEQQLAQKRNDLLKPVLDKIRTAMEKVAKQKGYDYVLNSVDGAGTSIVLWGPNEADITRAVVEELGIELEGNDQGNGAPAEGSKKKKK